MSHRSPEKTSTFAYRASAEHPPTSAPQPPAGPRAAFPRAAGGACGGRSALFNRRAAAAGRRGLAGGSCICTLRLSPSAGQPDGLLTEGSAL